MYPLLGFHKSKHPRPENCYVTWGDNVQSTDRKLVCVYKREDTDQWRNFEQNNLISHKFLDYCVPIDDNTIVYVFDFNAMAADFDAFLNGKFSQLSIPAKKLLNEYYGVHTPEWIYIESFIFPEKYFKQYATILNVDEDILRQVGELCEKPNMEKENCTIPHFSSENVTL